MKRSGVEPNEWNLFYACREKPSTWLSSSLCSVNFWTASEWVKGQHGQVFFKSGRTLNRIEHGPWILVCEVLCGEERRVARAVEVGSAERKDSLWVREEGLCLMLVRNRVYGKYLITLN